MTVQADLIRNRRRVLALPGGSHDRLVRVLSTWMPAAIGVIAAVMLLAPLAPRGDVSFLLDRNKVAIVKERLRVEQASYQGVDNRNRPFSITAGSAVQTAADIPVVSMDELTARIELKDGPAAFTASDGLYNFETEQVMVRGNVGFATTDGYRMVTRNVTIDLKNKLVTGASGVSGSTPTGTFSADRITADLAERSVALEGHARIQMQPGKLRIPQ